MPRYRKGDIAVGHIWHTEKGPARIVDLVGDGKVIFELLTNRKAGMGTLFSRLLSEIPLLNYTPFSDDEMLEPHATCGRHCVDHELDPSESPCR